MKNTFLTPISYCTGDGSEKSPYRGTDGTAGIQSSLAQLEGRGGLLRLPCARYDISTSIVLDLPSTKLAGDVWACNCDPNGVFETKYGTKIRMNGMNFPAICLGNSRCISGTLIEGIGVQGDIQGMDTRPLFNMENPCAGAGLALRAVRTDQCEVDKLSFCGLGAAIAVADNAEVDACQFTRCNMDGCGVGVYFSPRASYYARIRDCIVADTPYYGILVDGRERFIHNLEITGCHFVRNGGAFTEEHPQLAAVSLLNVSGCGIERNNFDDPGTFWYYVPTATKNTERQPQKRPCVALAVSGNKNRIRDNIFQHTRDAAIVINGDGNVLMNNISDGDVVIAGKGNQVIGLAFTKPEAKLILTKEAVDTVILGVEESRIVRQE